MFHYFVVLFRLLVNKWKVCVVLKTPGCRNLKMDFVCWNKLFSRIAKELELCTNSTCFQNLVGNYRVYWMANRMGRLSISLRCRGLSSNLYCHSLSSGTPVHRKVRLSLTWHVALFVCLLALLAFDGNSSPPLDHRKEHMCSYAMCVVYQPWCKCYALTWRVSRLKTDFGSKENQTLIIEKSYNDAISCLRFLNLIDAGLGVCIPSLLQQLCIGRYTSDEVLREQKRKGRAVSLIPRSISRHILSLLVPLTFLWFYPTRPWIMREIKQQYFLWDW